MDVDGLHNILRSRGSEVLRQALEDISSKGGFMAGNPRVLFKNSGWAWQASPNCDATPNRKGFVGVELGEEIISSPRHVVLNWQAGLLDGIAAQKH